MKETRKETLDCVTGVIETIDLQIEINKNKMKELDFIIDELEKDFHSCTSSVAIKFLSEEIDKRYKKYFILFYTNNRLEGFRNKFI